MHNLIVVDLQPEFIGKNKDSYNRILDFIKSSHYDKIFATRFVPGNKNFKDRLHFELSTGAVSQLEFEYDVLFDKTGYGLSDDQYKAFNKDHVYDIVGCGTDACILKIAMDMFDRGNHFYVLSDYVFTNSDSGDAALKILKRNVGDCVASEHIWLSNM